MAMNLYLDLREAFSMNMMEWNHEYMELPAY
jgi:hypothetical protein